MIEFSDETVFPYNLKYLSSTIDVLLAALAQMVVCLPLVQRVRCSIPGGVVNFYLKIFKLGARRGGPLGAFREEHAMSRHRVSLSPFLSSSSSSSTQHNYTTQTVTHTVILTSTFSSTLYRYSSHT